MFKLIIYNIFKHKFLFILIGLMVVLLCFYLMIGLNTVFSVSESLKRAVAENMTGDVIIASGKAKYLDVITKDGEKKIVPLEKWEEVLAFLRGKDYVRNASPRLRVWGLVKSDLNETPMIITGVDPDSEEGLLPNRTLESGRWVKTSNEIAMYYRHSDYLSTTNGAVLSIAVMTVDGYENFDTNRLVGIFDYKDLSFYTEFSFYGLVSLDYLNSLLMTHEKTASEIFVSLKNAGDLGRMKRDVLNQFGNNYRFILPQDSSNLVNGIYLLTQFSVWFVALLLILMVYLCSSFLVNISIETRRQEIGIYQALGVKKWRIALLFGGEFLCVLVLFAIIGISLGAMVVAGMQSDGIEATIIPLQLIFGRQVLYVRSYPGTVLVLCGILFLTFLGSVLTAVIKLSKLDPVEVMREL
ncbi:MAG: FtsX-like permease family protein [Brevinematales bacterium]|jgi:ABC-type lipoprotein release transport system permease subunit